MSKKKVFVNNDDKVYIFNCPHCEDSIEVLFQDTACCIFRHGILKSNFEQIPPHSTKKVCDELKDKDLIYGCGKPFFFHKGNEPYVDVCDYI